MLAQGRCLNVQSGGRGKRFRGEGVILRTVGGLSCPLSCQ